MRPTLKNAYMDTIRTADRVLSADKLIVADLRHDNPENIYYDADIMAAILNTWLKQLAVYRRVVEDITREVDANLETTVSEN